MDDPGPVHDFLVVRVWFEGPNRRCDFRARVLTGARGTSTAVAAPDLVVEFVSRWLRQLVEASPESARE